MKIMYDPAADALYIQFMEGKFYKNKQIDEDTILDLSKDGALLGLEILNASKKILPENLKVVQVDLPLTA